jgi:uncharacterized protein with PIN domain
MIAVDASAIIAILRREPEERIEDASSIPVVR